jgi:hypothetical protein
MRYANTKHSHQGIGVEPQPDKQTIHVVGLVERKTLEIQDVEQLKDLIYLLIDAGEINGWGRVL